jgi:hypothetical protein
MKKTLIFAALAITSCLSLEAEALLPPLFETINEYKMLITSDELGKRLDSGEAIVDIERREGGFMIITNKSTLEVDIVKDKQETPGPGKFHLVFHDKAPLL